MTDVSLPKDCPDSEIILRVRAGKTDVFAELIRRHQHALRCALSFYFHSSSDIEEQLQAAFVQAFVHLKEFDLNQSFYPWLRAIALNGLRQEFRRQQGARLRGADYLRHVQLSRFQYNDSDEIGEQRAAALKNCLQKLPLEDAKLVQDKYAGDQPLRDLAEKLKTTEGALKVRLLRLRNILRLCIEKQTSAMERGA
jgi:RNA polymerase sigma-70 factor, ECF subfamily